MNGGSSTFRPGHDRTTRDSEVIAPRQQLHEAIAAEWRRTSQPDLIVAIEQHPQLLRDQSLLLNLALEEYKSLGTQTNEIDLQQHCRRFGRFGSSLERSVFRQLETQKYLDEHPDLLNFISSPQWPEIHEEFGGFFIQEELGRGGISRVYLCVEREVGNRPVVVKVSPLTGIEASILGRLNHANIVPIHSTGHVMERDLSYICMPYRGRNTLADLIDSAFQRGEMRQSPVSAASEKPETVVTVKWYNRPQNAFSSHSRHYVDQVIEIAIKIGNALEFSHRAGIIHGDLKPSNILVTLEGEPLLLDFNLSQDLLNPAGWCGGTLPYMPPEHLERIIQYEAIDGKANFDVRTDVYSFAAVLYELLTGSPPIAIDIPSSDRTIIASNLLQSLQTASLQIRSKNRLVSAALESVILQSLAINPLHRPASVAIVRRVFELERRLLPTLYRRAKLRPRSTAIAAGSGLFLSVALIGYVAFRPPAFLATFDHGQSLISESDFVGAERSFRRSIASNPDFTPARLELARSLIRAGRPQAAVEELSRYLNTVHDLRCLVLLGYGHNLCRNHVLAIPCYLEATNGQIESAVVLNNLAASYRAAPNSLPPAERFSRPEQLLMKALELDSTAIAIRSNLIRLELAKSNFDPKHDPIAALPHVLFLKEREPDSKWAKSVSALWYAVAKVRSVGSSDAQDHRMQELDGVRLWLGPALTNATLGTLSMREFEEKQTSPNRAVESRTAGAARFFYGTALAFLTHAVEFLRTQDIACALRSSKFDLAREG